MSTNRKNNGSHQRTTAAQGHQQEGYRRVNGRTVNRNRQRNSQEWFDNYLLPQHPIPEMFGRQENNFYSGSGIRYSTPPPLVPIPMRTSQAGNNFSVPVTQAVPFTEASNSISQTTLVLTNNFDNAANSGNNSYIANRTPVFYLLVTSGIPILAAYITSAPNYHIYPGQPINARPIFYPLQNVAGAASFAAQAEQIAPVAQITQVIPFMSVIPPPVISQMSILSGSVNQIREWSGHCIGQLFELTGILTGFDYTNPCGGNELSMVVRDCCFRDSCIHVIRPHYIFAEYPNNSHIGKMVRIVGRILSIEWMMCIKVTVIGESEIHDYSRLYHVCRCYKRSVP